MSDQWRQPVQYPPEPPAPSGWPPPEVVPLPPAEQPGAPRPRHGRTALLAAAIGSVVGALVAGATFAVLDDDEPSSAASRPASTIPAGEGGGMDIRAVLDTISPSVVTIEVNGGAAAGGPFEAAGSGVVIDDEGLVLTNAHVVDRASRITIRSFTGADAEAELVGSFPDDDVALIRVLDPAGLDLRAATLGDSASLQVGDEVVAIGNALDLTGQPSVTRGIVSALNREIDGGGINLDDLIQTDAAINPGNSGGPLVDAAGTVVGINTAIISDAQNIGFAIAIDAVEPLIEQIEAGNAEITADTGFLGVETVDLNAVNPAVLEEFGVDVDEGAFVRSVSPGTAAADAGIEEGDVIVAIGGTEVDTSLEVRDAVRSHRAGDQVTIDVLRDGEELTLEATLGAITD
jgi:putative serine protease PepD